MMKRVKNSRRMKKQAVLVLLSAAMVVQTGFPGCAAISAQGSWQNENGAWKFYSPDSQAYTGWVKTSSGWYYLNPADGTMVTGWKQIDGYWYYFDKGFDGVEGRMHTGWYQDGTGNWFFFDNTSGGTAEGHMMTGWLYSECGWSVGE